MLLVCLVLSVLSMGVVCLVAKKNEKLAKETVEAKRDFLEARSKTILIEEDYREMRNTVKDMFNVVTGLKKEVTYLSEQVEIHRREIEYNRAIINELNDEVSYLKEDNTRLKRKLNMYDEVAPHCKLVTPIRANIK